MSLNSFLLSICCRHARLGTDVKSISQRYQILSLIYVNIILFTMYFIYDSIITFFAQTGFPYFLTMTSTSILICSFVLIHKQRFDLAAGVSMVCMHFADSIASRYIGSPMASLFALLVFPNFVFFLTSSRVVQNLNALICFVNAVDHVRSIKKKFEVTLTEEQSIEINNYISAAVICLIAVCVTCFVQKLIETNLWNMAQANFERSENLTKEVVQAAEAKDRFISSLSHEIRNPLNSMNGSVDYLLQVVKDPAHIQMLKNAKLSGEILLNLVNNVLDAAKLRSEKMEVSYTETNFVEVIKKVLIINSENLKRSKINVKAIISKELPEIIWTDPSRMLQIMMNLMSNALKFTREGGKITIRVNWFSNDTNTKDLLSLNKPNVIDVVGESQIPTRCTFPNSSTLTETSLDEFINNEEVENHKKKFEVIKTSSIKGIDTLNNPISIFSTIENWSIKTESPIKRFRSQLSQLSSEHTQREREDPSNSTKGFLQVQVSDTGCGIPEDKLPKLFGMFNQAHQSVGTMYGGTGLGLWISKQLCQKMGGDITVYSSVNNGSSFVFYIPINMDRMSSNNIRNSRQSGALHCLVVDDFGFNRDLHRLLLEREGVHVSLAQNGKEALEKYKKNPNEYFDFILMDVLMPEMDGFTSAKLIRKFEAEQQRKKVDIYFVSGEYYNEEEVMAEFKHKEDVNEITGIKCLRKPIDIDTIRRVVERLRNN